jgi:tRNA dimethylallyltransferase
LVGGTHFYFDALFKGLPLGTAPDLTLRHQLENRSAADLFAQIKELDPARAEKLDPNNRRRLIRALEIVHTLGKVPERRPPPPPATKYRDLVDPYMVEWVVMDPSRDELRTRIDARLTDALARGLVEEVERVQAQVGEKRLNELGLEYRVVGEFLRAERSEPSLFPTLSSKLWQYARRQKAWLRKLRDEEIIAEAQ